MYKKFINKILNKVFYSKVMKPYRNKYAYGVEKISEINYLISAHCDIKLSVEQDTYDILKDISSVWEELQPKEVDLLSKMIAGAKDDTIFKSLMNNQ